MNRAGFLRYLGLALACAIGFSAYVAQAKETPAPASGYKPSVGQSGKDVPWVPTPQGLVDQMLKMAKVTKNDYLIDLGSGDGRLVITAAKRGAKALGIEYNPDMVELSQQFAKEAGVTGRAKFVKADIFESDFSDATVITMFLLRDINLKLRPKILDLKPGTRILSNTFDMGEWKPDQTENLKTSRCGGAWCTAHLWIVPAKVEGTHKIPNGELVLRQEFQMVHGTLRRDGNDVPVEGKVIGDEVRLDAGGKSLRAKMNNGHLQMR